MGAAKKAKATVRTSARGSVMRAVLARLAGAGDPLPVAELTDLFDGCMNRASNFLRYAAERGYSQQVGTLRARGNPGLWRITLAGLQRLDELDGSRDVAAKPHARQQVEATLPPAPRHPALDLPVFAACSTLAGAPLTSPEAA